MASMVCSATQGARKGLTESRRGVGEVWCAFSASSPCRPSPRSTRRRSSRPEAAADPAAACTAQSSTPPPQTAAKTRGRRASTHISPHRSSDRQSCLTQDATESSIKATQHQVMRSERRACVCVCVSYHKGDDAPLCRLPFKAAFDVRAVVEQDHDAPHHTVEVLLQQLGWKDGIIKLTSGDVLRHPPFNKLTVFFSCVCYKTDLVDWIYSKHLWGNTSNPLTSCSYKSSAGLFIQLHF